MKGPAPTFERPNFDELRNDILSLLASEARKLGIGKSTLHYLRKSARDRKLFKVYQPVLEKLSELKNSSYAMLFLLESRSRS